MGATGRQRLSASEPARSRERRGRGRADPPPEQVATVDEHDRHARHLGAAISRDVARARTRTARSAAGRRSAPAPRPRRASPPDSARASRRTRCRRRAGRAATTPYVSAASDIHGRRHTATNASYQRGVSIDASHASHSSAPNGAGTGAPTRCGQRAHLGPDVVRPSAATSSAPRDPPSTSARRVLDAVLLVVHDDEIGRERDDRGDVGVLRPADRRRRRGCSQNRVHATGATPSATQRLGRRRDERDDPSHGARVTCARAAAPSSPRTRPR